MVLGYYDSNGWPRMVPGGSAEFNTNPDGVRQLVMDLWVTMDYVCHDPINTTAPKIGNAIVQTASNMDPGAEFTYHSFLEITQENQESAFDVLKGYIDNGWPVVIAAGAGFRYYLINLGTYEVLTGGHAMVMTGYRDAPASRMIFLNSGRGYPKDKMRVDYDDLTTNMPEFVLTICVIPGGKPHSDAVPMPWVPLLLMDE
jgi:hypothetical protein